VDRPAFQVFTALLTVYALTGDDFRLLGTDKPADAVFDAATVFCILVFALEILVSVLGREDYFGSFFFFLDLVATVTMVLDITAVNNWLQDAEQGGMRDNTSFGKLGAKTARIVRVIRLVRILKLYKAVYEASRAGKKSTHRRLVAAPGHEPGEEDDWDDLAGELAATTAREGNLKESRVGKRLSDLTIRKVILIVLLTMIVNRSLHSETSTQGATSAMYAADLVHEAFERMQASELPSELPAPHAARLRSSYERSLLDLVYYHNWYTGHADVCPNGKGLCSRAFLSHLFWLGVVSDSKHCLYEKAAAAQVSEGAVRTFESMARSQANQSADADNYVYAYGNMPAEVQAKLGAAWSADCDRGGGYRRRGISLIGDLLPSWGVTYEVRCPDDLRPQEIKKYSARVGVGAGDEAEWHLAFYFDLRPFTRQEAIGNLMTTAWVCFALCIASAVMTYDANRLVLTPVEKMMDKVEAIRNDPLSAMKVADQEFKMEEINKATFVKHSQRRCRWFRDLVEGGSQVELMETVVLEKTIIKLGSLLALGFGEAGASIIEHNMRGEDSTAINVMVTGVRVECIIGACRIRDFGIATEVLQEKVMTFVNQIAEIVHGVVDECHGYSSMNSGDQFLLIWRTSEIMGDADLLRRMADMSMLAFARILGSIHRSPVLASYRGHPGLQQRLGTNCRVNVSCGLHYGWTIEGGIGSEFKIDASYLSPNVSIAESMERATETYGVSILVSSAVIQVCSASVAKRCRLIDRVVITGSKEALELYAIDLDHACLTVERPRPPKPWTSRQRFRARRQLDKEKAQKWNEEFVVADLFDDPVISAMRSLYSVEFLHVFNMGYQNYSEGQWEAAQRMLTRTRDMLGVVDGPSNALLTFMARDGFKAPFNWHGIRTGTLSLG